MALKEDNKYGLLSRDSLTAANINCFHVKLTDSSLKFIEDFIKSNRSARPTLEVNEDFGIFRIPDGNGHRDFTFTVSPLSGDPNGSFDCIKQIKDGKLETLDSITQKIVVKANEDVYQTTRDKLAEKNEENKKNCAKELDNSKGAIKSKKVIKTIKRNGTNHHATSQPSKIASTTSLSPNPYPSSGSSPFHSTPAMTSPSGSSAKPVDSTLANVANSRTTAAKKLDKIKRKQQSKLNSAAKEAAVAHIKTSELSKSDKEKAKAALLSVPLRERVVHTLALKPFMYDTPNLLLKLRSEGLGSSNDHSSASDLSHTLDTVATTNSKGCWAIKPEFLHEVDPNWSFYSETDKQLVNRNMARVSTKPVVAVHPTSDSLKRKHADNHQNMPAKSQKFTEDCPEDFLKKYTKVTDPEQRNRYKEDFNQEYPEYKHLFDYIGGVTNKFAALAEKLSAATQGSPEYQKVEKAIRKEYKAVTSSKEYVTSKPRLEYLHKKLAHIKSLVCDYDNSLLH